ncbi:hypothetical protein FGO68_gene13896 [Halteria grandinella]|uniref:Uncharacterized protein n=1 Tax=Halteria grandinella TaxID=5974 RepID=A0A8J8NWV8_HALGN|nr:hypothetical protein FGO68_gene13896 [Halteria grandinella]
MKAPRWFALCPKMVIDELQAEKKPAFRAEIIFRRQGASQKYSSRSYVQSISQLTSGLREMAMPINEETGSVKFLEPFSLNSLNTLSVISKLTALLVLRSAFAILQTPFTNPSTLCPSFSRSLNAQCRLATCWRSLKEWWQKYSWERVGLSAVIRGWSYQYLWESSGRIWLKSDWTYSI